MINKLIIDDERVELKEGSTPYYHTFPQAKTHNVKFGLDNGEEICAYAFKGCKDLTSIKLPDKITMIKRHAFDGCESLPTITLGKNIKYIGKGAFDGCTNLSEIIFEGEDPSKIDMYATLPGNTTCFVPNNTKYVKVDNFDQIDFSGDTQYYTKTEWNQYEEIFDVTEIEEEHFGEDLAHTTYINQWSKIGTGNRLREIKDKVPVSGLKLKTTSGNEISSTSMNENSSFMLTYQIMPADATNLNIYWMTTNPAIYVVETGRPGEIKINTTEVSSTTRGVVTAYAESGQKASITITVTK